MSSTKILLKKVVKQPSPTLTSSLAEQPQPQLTPVPIKRPILIKKITQAVSPPPTEQQTKVTSAQSPSLSAYPSRLFTEEELMQMPKQEVLTTYEGRLSIISHSDPQHAVEIIEFLEHNPEFRPYRHLIPINRHPLGYGMYSFEAPRADNPKNFLEFLLFYVCEAGVRATYAKTQWDMLYPVFRRLNYDLTASVADLAGHIQPKKRQVYLDIDTYLKTHAIKPLELGLDHIKDLQATVTGVGVGAVAFLHHRFAEDHGVEYAQSTDIGFFKGYMKVYNLTKRPTKAQVDQTVAGWGKYKRIGSDMLMQIYRYSDANPYQHLQK